MTRWHSEIQLESELFVDNAIYSLPRFMTSCRRGGAAFRDEGQLRSAVAVVASGLAVKSHAAVC
jgi:hypothetical protein